MDEATYWKYWGKANKIDRDAPPVPPTFHLLPYHCLDVAAVAHVLLEKDPMIASQLARILDVDVQVSSSLVTYLIALHDVGKFSEGFQNLRSDVFRILNKRASTKAYPHRHDALGHVGFSEFIFDVLWEEDWLGLQASDGDEYDWKDVFLHLASATAGHHGQPASVDMDGLFCFEPEDREALIAFGRHTAKLLWPGGASLAWSHKLVNAAKRASWLLAGLATLTDWIGSDDQYFEFCMEPMDIAVYWETRALPTARRAIAEKGILLPPTSQQTGMGALFSHIEQPSPMQSYADRASLSDGPELFIIEDATGSGKTEAALVLAHRLMAAGSAQGMYVALPTMATANAMFKRVKDAYEKLFEEPRGAQLILSHGARSLSDDYQEVLRLAAQAQAADHYDANDETAHGQSSTWLADSRKTALLAAVGVGTIDQALLGVLPARHQSMRLLGLHRSVLIVDEVHAYDTYMNELLCRLLQFHAAHGGSAILLSATLPQTMRNELCGAFARGLGMGASPMCKNAFPLVTHLSAREIDEQHVASRPGTEREVGVSFYNDEAAVERALLETARHGRCACWIRNTVGDAIDAYNRLAANPDVEVTLFHSRFAMCDRQRIENDVLGRFGKESGHERRKHQILVATQVVEQSLDLDFDTMISDLAPIDLLIQRAGRLHRHRRDANGNIAALDARGTPMFGILSPAFTEEPDARWYARLFPGANYVYPDTAKLWLTARVLRDLAAIRIPEDARTLIDAVYGEDVDVPETLLEVSDHAFEVHQGDLSVARFNALKFERGYGESVEKWLPDTVTPTRLGEPTTTLRLAKLKDNKVEPWAGPVRHGWQMSEASIRASAVTSSQHRKQDLAAIARATDAMKDKGKWSVLVVLRPEEDQVWRAEALNGNDEPVTIQYSNRFGLQILKES